MFTSRAEHRLLLREDNADLRLTPVGRALGLVDDDRWDCFERRREWLDAERERLRAAVVRPADVEESGFERPVRNASAWDLLRRPDVRYRDLAALPRVGHSAELDTFPAELGEHCVRSLEVEAHYAGYVERQGAEIERQRRQASTRLPQALDYAEVRGLSNELREKLARARPDDIDQASRISGMTPAALALLVVHVKKLDRRIAS